VDFILAGLCIRLIDTPGFDDTTRSDADILEDIAQWLADTYDNGILLTRIILLQPISTNKVCGGEARRTRLFKKICGKNAYGNVVTASTMWSELNDESQGYQRVSELESSDDFWGDMVRHGAQVVKHGNDSASAHRIIRMLICKPRTALQMQYELQDCRGQLIHTSAARQLDHDLGALSEKERRRLAAVTEDLKYAREDRQEVMREFNRLQERFIVLQGEKEQIRTSRVSQDVSVVFLSLLFVNTS
jgi:hypothetical protein